MYHRTSALIFYNGFNNGIGIHEHAPWFRKKRPCHVGVSNAAQAQNNGKQDAFVFESHEAPSLAWMKTKGFSIGHQKRFMNVAGLVPEPRIHRPGAHGAGPDPFALPGKGLDLHPVFDGSDHRTFQRRTCPHVGTAEGSDDHPVLIIRKAAPIIPAGGSPEDTGIGGLMASPPQR
jgi:hypothetical protein